MVYDHSIESFELIESICTSGNKQPPLMLIWLFNWTNLDTSHCEQFSNASLVDDFISKDQNSCF
jgi:hypothetical protein